MKLIRKLIIGISTLGLLVMTLVSATYAWFEINERATVDNFRFEVHGGNGFLVSIDNVNWSSDLRLEQIQKAMLVSYGAGQYKLATDGSENLTTIFNDEEIVLTNDEIAQLVNEKLKFLPSTTDNGRNFKDQYNGQIKVTSGNYVEFGVYFRTASTIATDNFLYNIYLNGNREMNDAGEAVEPTMITDVDGDGVNAKYVHLSADMNAVIPSYAKNDTTKTRTELKRSDGDKVLVYSANAIRLSITENNPVEYNIVDEFNNPVLDEAGNPTKGIRYVTNEASTKMYELNDTENPNTDLGSYATDYHTYCVINNIEEDIDEGNLYDSRWNAMFTYYNRLKQDAPITHISYENKPKTIKDLSNKDIITSVRSGDEAKLLTFRLWLEGWDADCFDGLKYAVRVRLAFGSTKIE